MKKPSRAEVDASLAHTSDALANFRRFALLSARNETVVVRGFHPDYDGQYLFEIGFSQHWNHVLQVTWEASGKVESAEVHGRDEILAQARSMQLLTDIHGAQALAWLDGWERAQKEIHAYENPTAATA